MNGNSKDNNKLTKSSLESLTRGNGTSSTFKYPRERHQKEKGHAHNFACDFRLVRARTLVHVVVQNTIIGKQTQIIVDYLYRRCSNIYSFWLPALIWFNTSTATNSEFGCDLSGIEHTMIHPYTGSIFVTSTSYGYSIWYELPIDVFLYGPLFATQIECVCLPRSRKWKSNIYKNSLFSHTIQLYSSRQIAMAFVQFSNFYRFSQLDSCIPFSHYVFVIESRITMEKWNLQGGTFNRIVSQFVSLVIQDFSIRFALFAN